tara:strand:- start:57 stop:200 length:144 start_codon:yes stop_codon:yes gene_type:complete
MEQLEAFIDRRSGTGMALVFLAVGVVVLTAGYGVGSAITEVVDTLVA